MRHESSTTRLDYFARLGGLFDHLLNLDEEGRRCFHQIWQHWPGWLCDDVDAIRLKDRAGHGGIVGEFDNGWRYGEWLSRR